MNSQTNDQHRNNKTLTNLQGVYLPLVSAANTSSGEDGGVSVSVSMRALPADDPLGQVLEFLRLRVWSSKLTLSWLAMMMLRTMTLHSRQTGTKGPFMFSSMPPEQVLDFAGAGGRGSAASVLDRFKGARFRLVGGRLQRFLLAMECTDSEWRKVSFLFG